MNVGFILEYDGSRYNGWQKQGNTANTIQEKLETVLEKMTSSFQEIQGAGRTDAGVHASGQVVNVHLDTNLTQKEIKNYLNRYLPEDIRVIAVEAVPERFHSRLWAKEKIYTYWIDMESKSCVFQRKYMYALGERLDVSAMKQAAIFLEGTHDFGSFCTGKNKKKSTVRTIKQIEILEHGSQLEIRMTGDGFLYNMVRILTGTLIETGQGKRSPESVKQLLEVIDRQRAGFTAPARGLFLTKVIYEEEIFHIL